jgi:SAM-dependent methyltransferase
MSSIKLNANKKTWDSIAGKYYGSTALPSWGPYDVCSDQNILGTIKNKTFLEIGCGSGHSIQYLVQKGAKKIYGIDISQTQIDYAMSLNQKYIETKTVQLFQSPMEKRLDVEPVDIVFSIYAIGWTIDPDKVFQNIYSYLKPTGRFIWSWEHPIFSKVKYENEKLFISSSYFDENVKFRKDWGEGVYMYTRTIASWSNALIKNGFAIRNILEPKPLHISQKLKDSNGYYSSIKALNIPSTLMFICDKKS